MNVSLKNRMGTASHGGDGGPMEDGEDRDDDAVRAAAAAAGVLSGGERADGAL